MHMESSSVRGSWDMLHVAWSMQAHYMRSYIHDIVRLAKGPNEGKVF